MITTRTKALRKLGELEDELNKIIKSSSIGITKEVSTRYYQLIPEIVRNISYYGDIAHVRSVYDKSLGKVNVKTIERFVQDNLN
jgi:hypothetical protein